MAEILIISRIQQYLNSMNSINIINYIKMSVLVELFTDNLVISWFWFNQLVISCSIRQLINSWSVRQLTGRFTVGYIVVRLRSVYFQLLFSRKWLKQQNERIELSGKKWISIKIKGTVFFINNVDTFPLKKDLRASINNSFK